MIPISGLIDQTLKKLPCAKKIKGQMLIDAWPQAVGQYISVKSEAVFFEQGVLTVRVRDSVWAQHLSLQKKQIISTLNRITKTRVLTDIRFLVGLPVNRASVAAAAQEAHCWRQKNLTEQDLAPIEAAFWQTDLPGDLQESMKSFFIVQKKRLHWSLEQGDPACIACGMPLVVTAKESYCLCCKTEEKG